MKFLVDADSYWLLCAGVINSAKEIVPCRECSKIQHDKLFEEWWCGGREVNPDGFCEKCEVMNEQVR